MLSEEALFTIELVIRAVVLAGSLVVIPNLFGVSLGPLWSVLLRAAVLLGLVTAVLLLPTEGSWLASYSFWLSLPVWALGFRILFQVSWSAAFLLAGVNWGASFVVKLVIIVALAFDAMMPSGDVTNRLRRGVPPILRARPQAEQLSYALAPGTTNGARYWRVSMALAGALLVNRS
jgi:hypothetical protein